jgi:hypothetical protein
MTGFKDKEKKGMHSNIKMLAGTLQSGVSTIEPE